MESEVVYLLRKFDCCVHQLNDRGITISDGAFPLTVNQKTKNYEIIYRTREAHPLSIILENRKHNPAENYKILIGRILGLQWIEIQSLILGFNLNRNYPGIAGQTTKSFICRVIGETCNYKYIRGYSGQYLIDQFANEFATFNISMKKCFDQLNWKY